ncbi:hypothetical protein J1605_005560 [Eschrichtius robustus]|uniref:CREG-like beta-barrel domain-containing protein n=1 Tax=Eschrichtius robustus TaxID=9764 RepID=A0AB34H8Z2_ESCRO|nr:hypothetical protein J1605_005560 [Eschrichtius robustus]
MVTIQLIQVLLEDKATESTIRLNLPLERETLITLSAPVNIEFEERSPQAAFIGLDDAHCTGRGNGGINVLHSWVFTLLSGTLPMSHVAVGTEALSQKARDMQIGERQQEKTEEPREREGSGTPAPARREDCAPRLQRVRSPTSPRGVRLRGRPRAPRPRAPAAGGSGSLSASAVGGRCSRSPGPDAPRKMSGRRGRQPGPRLSWLLCCSALLSRAAGYVLVSSVSWAVTNEVDEELDSASTEEALPALLEDSGSIWQRSFPASAHEEDAHLPPPEGTARARPPPAPPGMFSYRREDGARLRPDTARFLAHASAWGCLATVSAHEKVMMLDPAGLGKKPKKYLCTCLRISSALLDDREQKIGLACLCVFLEARRVRKQIPIPGLPFGNCLPVSDGPFNNSTGVPFFYVTPKDLLVADLMKNPTASLLLPESEGEFCR